MNAVDYISMDDMAGCPFPFFNGPAQPDKKVYKIYHDGGNYVATIATSPSASFARICRKLENGGYKKHAKKVDTHGEANAIDILFDSLYVQAVKDGLKDGAIEKALTDYIRAGILKLFPDYSDIDEYVEKKIKGKKHNLAVRKKRFRRKANLNRWNYFVTFTYDDEKQTPDSFRNKLRKCLSNLHTRRGWRYMGVFECAPETGRLHFHGLLYVPDDEMIGTITEKEDYSTAQHKMQKRNENSFFERAFGRNDFTGLSKMQLKYGHTIDYIVKYIGKTGEKICYSRGIPTEIYKALTDDDIITEFTDFATKYVLFDNVVDWEDDVKRYTKDKQLSVWSVFFNPPNKVA